MTIASEQIRSFLERIERLEIEKKIIADDIKEVYSEAKSSGYDAAVLRKIVSIRKLDANERMEQEAIMDLYLSALGMLPDDYEPTESEQGLIPIPAAYAEA